MEKSVSHLGEYIQDIMEVSRNTSREVTPTAIRFKHLINEIVSGIQHMEEFRQVRVEVAIDQPAEFKCDQSGLETIFSNLISNAVLYHDASKADPYVSVKVRVKESEAFCVVEDNGQGIDEAQLDKVFDKFYRASTEKQGTGLGLYLVRQSVLKLGGMIDVQSAVGKGTKFSFSLPGLEGTT
jgi:signal transduction histidine kinase